MILINLWDFVLNKWVFKIRFVLVFIIILKIFLRLLLICVCGMVEIRRLLDLIWYFFFLVVFLFRFIVVKGGFVKVEVGIVFWFFRE